MRTAISLTVLATAFACSLATAPANARARVFVASYGNDANPCTFGSPCKTFQHAHDIVDAGGEVTAIDSAGFGPINITKAVTITSPPGVEAGIVPNPPTADAIDISAGPSDVVELHGLTVDGAGVGHDGIAFNTGKSLIIAGCVFRNFTSEGIAFFPSASSTLRISDTLLDNNADAGIYLVQSGSGTVAAAFERVEAANNHNGMVIQGSSVSAPMLNATIADSVVANNANGGIASVTATGSAPVTVMVLRSVVANNTFGMAAQNANDTILVGQTAVTGNANGWGTLTGGTLQSYGDNKIDGNVSNQSAPPSISNK
jgi:hypothetical protein